ncbi:MAG: hypothetical protein C4308_07915 [Chitinophagaceae bacterium]
MSVRKNVQFTRLLKGQRGLSEFNFLKSFSDDEVIFKIDVTDERSNRISFVMQKTNNTWQIHADRLPEWIIEHEATLHNCIEAELTEAG